MSNHKFNLKFLFLTFGSVIFLWTLSWGLIHFFMGGADSPGIFGDQFGAINSLFSGLAFAGLIVTIYLQRQEISLQRKELELTREEISGQKEQLTRQADLTTIQIFEVSFYNLLDLFFDHKVNMKRNVQTNNLELFHYLRVDFKNNLEKIENEQSAYHHFYNQFHNILSVYFRLLYNALKFVDESTTLNKKNYTDFLRATLSDDEIFLIHQNLKYHPESGKLKTLCSKYNILKHLKT